MFFSSSKSKIAAVGRFFGEIIVFSKFLKGTPFVEVWGWRENLSVLGKIVLLPLGYLYMALVYLLVLALSIVLTLLRLVLWGLVAFILFNCVAFLKTDRTIREVPRGAWEIVKALPDDVVI